MQPKSEASGHDVVVVGASSGGVEALRELVDGLPADFPAALFVVVHRRPDSTSRLPELLSRPGKLSATHAVHGEPIQPGRIYVAPPDMHLMIRRGHVRVERGPRENGNRPSIDALFRTASMSYGPRVIGVVLTGYLDCGTAGLLSIKARGGLVVVQEPSDAAVPDMPRSALRHTHPDHVVPLAQMARLLTRLSAVPAGPWPAGAPRDLKELEGEELGARSELVCPTCQGVLTETRLNDFVMYRCHVGHTFSMASAAAEQADEVERALWAAKRALEEAAALSQRFAARTTGDLRQRFEEKRQAQMHEAQVLERILLGGALLDARDIVAAGRPEAEADEP